jgi:hypothetical protein
MPRQSVSNFDQRVTQWMSAVTSVEFSALNDVHAAD